MERYLAEIIRILKKKIVRPVGKCTALGSARACKEATARYDQSSK
jgi:hypothetical protein